ncbi:TonB-dependent siderophore receptor [Corallococcus exiguus]|uniref:TonB-dependent siderophore receptor n=1 Tax=Corallococcus exiguus TaxID=83462 RepID=A0A7X4YDU8_9BACT|nr:TonB-dependent siderophore receptor [Corallococcus exiguus]TNV60416.1 TonB-dependent siderophore receptor [Corallococcus exiguus]
MSTAKPGRTGIRSSNGNPGGVRGTLWPWGPAAVGLASALAAGGAVAQETPVTGETSAPVQESRPAETPRVGQDAPAPERTPESAPTGAPEAEAGQDDAYVLPEVSVEGETEKYNVTEPSLARLPRPLVDTPQTITVVPERVMEEQQAMTLRDALRNVSGITVTAGEGGRQGDSFSLRGFSAQTDTLRDGVRDLGWFTRDTFNLEGVEVYFGPSSVLFGRGSTGGAINLVTKKARKGSFTDLRLSGGTAPIGRIEADVNQELSDSVQFRVSAVGQLAGVAGRDVVKENRAGIAPSARFQLADKVALEVDYFYQHEDSMPDYGQPYFNGYPVGVTLDVPRENFYGVKDSDAELVNVHIGSARLLADLGNTFRLTNTLRYGGVDRFARPTAPRGLTPATDPTTIGRQRFETSTDNTYFADQLDVRGVFNTGFLKHTANFGLDVSREQRELGRVNLTTASGNLPADLFEPDNSPDLSGVNRVPGATNYSRQWNLGAYASDQIQIGKYVEVLGTLRLDNLHSDYETKAANGDVAAFEQENSLFNWRVGLVLHPAENTSVYGMYGTSQNPSAELATLANDTVTLDPEKNETFEVGAKADLIAERLSVNAALFRTNKLNARVPNSDPDGPPTVLEGKQRVQGYALGIAGSPVRRWNVFANYTFLDASIREHTNEFLVGQRLVNTPKRSFSLWTTYAILDNLSVGGGATYQDVAPVNNPANATVLLTKVPNFWRFDAFASYSIKKVDLQLNVYNLTDKLYYDSYYGGQAVPADGVSALLSAHVRF